MTKDTIAKVKSIIVDQLLFRTQFEMAHRLEVCPTDVRQAVMALREQGYRIAKLARRDERTKKMLPAFYYLPYNSRDLDITEVTKRGRPSRADAYDADMVQRIK